MRELRADDPRSAGTYRLLARLGEGGMGRVYLGRSPGGRTVAVKLVHPELAARPEFRMRFRREVDAARRVSGPWTAPVLDADPDAESPWVATGYVAGPSLHEVATGPYGPLPARSLQALANGLTRALSDIHAAGLVHRDLKPANVLVTIDGPRVIDFGIARAADPADGADLTRTGVTVGSPGFMPPEQIRGEQPTAAGDVFALGAVLAFAATGRGPFGDAELGVPGLLVRVVQDEKDLTGVPDGIRGLVADCLAPAPGDRPTLAELLERTAAGDLWQPRPGDEPWVPAPLVAHLGRKAVELLDSDAPPPDTATRRLRTPAPPPTVVDPSAAPAPRPRTRAVAAAAAVALLGAGLWYGINAAGSEDGGGKGNGKGAPTSSVSAGPSAGSTGAAITAADAAGFWEGTGRRADSGTVFHRFHLTGGKVGDVIGTVHAVFPQALCAAELTLEAVDGDRLVVSSKRLYDVPAGSCEFTGRSTFSRSGSTLSWEDSALTVALKPAVDEGRKQAVPGFAPGKWRFRDDSGNEHTLTLSQGPVTDPLVAWSRQGSDGSRCAWQHRLLAVDTDGGLLFGPGSDTTSQPAGVCKDADMAAFRFRASTGSTAELATFPEGSVSLRLTRVP
ncbi:serine/threonine-protein kinase [Streptomyces sp. NPDC051940]|uniref:serine/threonine-protein kinase n=1 Tax=Streptomyces sp. NPDC051940 TaxID=3155675 RepID=UPI0034284CA7